MSRDSPVSEVMRRDVPTADASEMVDIAVERLQGCNCQTIPVLRYGRLVGLLTLDNVGELISVRSALGARPRA
jgi:CBS-domain-containing membrane protein